MREACERKSGRLAEGRRVRKGSQPGEPLMRWGIAPCEAPLDIDSDAQLLRDTLRLPQLPRRHPVRVLRKSEATQARMALHHLADDLRILHGVPGLGDVVSYLRTGRHA